MMEKQLSSDPEPIMHDIASGNQTGALIKSFGKCDDFDGEVQCPSCFDDVEDVYLWDFMVENQPNLAIQIYENIESVMEKYEEILEETKKKIRKEDKSISEAELTRLTNTLLTPQILDMFHKEIIFSILTHYEPEIKEIGQSYPAVNMYADIVGVGKRNFSDNTKSIVKNTVEAAFALFLAMRLGGNQLATKTNKLLQILTKSRWISGL